MAYANGKLQTQPVQLGKSLPTGVKTKPKSTKQSKPKAVKPARKTK